MSRTCASCERDLAPDARFCDGCGTPMEQATEQATPAGDRKVVTILFADLSGSTSLQERLDAEATSRLMARVQEVLGAAVEEHGGSVVKSTGDGLMAVFGVPVLREDDAVRGVRAGIAMQDSFAALGLDAVSLRVGVNTGEVVVSPGTDDVVGDPVNVAARLEAAAGLGEVFVGPETARLIRDEIALAPVAPLTLKGKRAPVAASRVVDGDVAGPSGVTPFLGREEDLDTLIAVVDDAVTARAARLVTVLGWPGLGKSRLASELTARVGERVTIVEARFVADGASSFGPIADAIRRAVDLASLDLGADRDRVVETIEALLAGGTAGSTEQVFWSIRRVLEAMAIARPVMIVLDDLHWAEAAMLDLVEHLVEWLRDGPVALVALARPELRDSRPALLESGAPSSVLVLGRLDPDACRNLAIEVLGGQEAPEEVLQRALTTSEGNPLFLRELLRLLVDDGVLVRDADGRWTLTVEVDAIELPATIHAALAARIEQLAPDERAVLQAASVIGRHFERGAVESLLSGSVAARLDEHLRSLHRRALVDPEGTWWRDERLFRFHHVLIRDAAYRRVLKEVRADHHVRYADWLVERIGDDTAEHDEVLGYHLEQAIAYRAELREPIDVATVERAVHHLTTAGRRALDGDDLANAAALLGRALALTPGEPDLLRDRCEALVASGDIRTAMDAVAELAVAASDERTRALADVFDAQLTAQRSPDALRSVASRAASAAAILSAQGDDVGVAHAESVQATALAGLGQIAACEAALDRSLAAARRAGDTRRANAVLSIAPAAALWGPSPIARASGRCLDVVRVLRITSWAPHVEAHALRHQAVLEAMRDRAEAARRMLATAKQTFTDLGHRLGLLEVAMNEGLVELLDDDAAAAEAPLRRAVEGFEALGVRVSAARATALLARAVLELDRLDEAEVLADPLLAGDDLKASIGLLGVAAEVLARRGDASEAEALARRAVALAEPTDALVDHADARLSLASVLTVAGKYDDAERERERARDLYQTKGATVGLRRAESDVLAEDARPAGADPANRRSDPITGKTARRIVRNAAVEIVERWHVAMLHRDFAGARAAASPDRITVNHRVDPIVELGRITTTVGDFEAPGVTVDQEVLAALGDRHVLVRRLWRYPSDGERGLIEMDNIAVVRVDESGTVVRADTFDGASDLSGPLLCLFERWAEDELDGDDADRARRQAATWGRAEALNAGDWDRLAEMMEPDIKVVDHRQTGVTMEGIDAYLDWLRAGRDAAELYEARIDDVLALSSRASLTRWHAGGDVHGAAFSLPSYVVTGSGPSGATRCVEIFTDEQLDDAWVCFDRLSPRSTRPGAERSVAGNLATAVARRRSELMRAGEMEAARALFSPELVVMDHRVQSEFPRRDHVEGITSRVPRTDEVEPLATLGARHGLCRSRQEWQDDDGATIEWSLLNVIVADVGGRYARIDTFDRSSLAEALACLVVRWAEDELDDSERQRGLQIARCFGMFDAIRDADWSGFAAVFEEDAELRDLRDAATGGIQRGRAEISAWLRGFVEAAERSTTDLVDVLDLTPERSLWSVRNEGTAVGGGSFERSSLLALRFGATGGVAAARLFNPEAIEAARSWLDAGSRPTRRVAPNQATAAIQRRIQARLAQDVDAFAALLADDYVRVAHSLQTQFSKADELQFAADTWDETGSVQWEVIASLGERHCLILMRFGWVERGHGGEAEMRRLQVCRTDASGRLTKVDSFEGDELAAALAGLVAGWADDEATPEERRLARGLVDGFHAVAAIRQRDWDRYRRSMSDGMVLVDHRETGAGEVRGADAVVSWFRAFYDATDEMVSELTDVFAVAPTAAMLAVRSTGAVGGAPFDIPAVVVMAVGTSGRGERFELFAPNDVDDAWRRYEELCRDANRLPRRAVRANSASLLIERWATSFNARDLDAANALRAPGYERPDRHWHHLVDRNTAIALDEATSIDGRAEIEVLATIGERDVLSRLRFLVGDAVTERFIVTTASIDGVRIERDELFGPDQLDGAIASMLEQAALRHTDAGERMAALQWARVPHGFRMGMDDDWQGVRALLADDVVYTDRRVTGVGEIRSADEAVRVIRSGVAGTDGHTITMTDVLVVSTERLVVEVTQAGSRDGVVFEERMLIDVRRAADGRMVSYEALPLTERDALLTGSDVAAVQSRRVAQNRASAVVERWAAAVTRADDDEVAALKAPGYERVHHDWHTTTDADGASASDAHLARSTTVGVELLATLGERHALTIVRFEDVDVPGSSSERYVVTRCTADGGATIHDDTFAPEDLDLALACLIERWAEDEASPADRPRARHMAAWWSYGRLVRAREWEAYGELSTEDIVFVDHRPTGVGEITGRAAAVAWIRELAEATDGIDVRVEDVLALTPRTALLQNVASGTASGGDWFIPSYIAVRFASDGRAGRVEFFPIERIGDAWPCFDRLEGEAPPRSGRRSPPNLATTTLERSLRDAAHGADAVRALYSPSYRVERHDHHVEIDLRSYQAEESWLVDNTAVDAEVIVTVGERHCLYRFGYTWPGDGDSGETRVEHLVVCRVDGEGRFALEDALDADDLEGALVCLIDRWAEDELGGWRPPVERGRFWSFPELLESCDWAAISDLFAADGTFVDCRPASFGEVRGRDAIVDWLRAYRESVDSEHIELVDVLALAPGAALLVYRAWGEVSGSPWETAPVVLAVFDDEGRVAHHEDWSPEQLDEAWARYDELVAHERADRT
jgi:class 3 adenylate cyclase/tetratricopeptide (TPR) repeat protein